MKKQISILTSVLLVSGTIATAFTLNFHSKTPEGALAQARDKVTLCHKGITIKVNQSAVSAHLAHGDTQGECQ